jgi:hypothetical protein
MSEEKNNVLAEPVAAPKPEDRILDLNTTVFGTTGEPEDVFLLTEEEEDRSALLIAKAVKAELESPGEEFDMLKVVKEILAKSTGKEILFYAVRGMHDCVDHCVDKSQQQKLAKVFGDMPEVSGMY